MSAVKYIHVEGVLEDLLFLLQEQAKEKTNQGLHLSIDRDDEILQRDEEHGNPTHTKVKFIVYWIPNQDQWVHENNLLEKTILSLDLYQEKDLPEETLLQAIQEAKQSFLSFCQKAEEEENKLALFLEKLGKALTFP